MRGDELHAFCESLYPICRSITGAGNRKTLELIARHIELSVKEVPTGTPVFDWQVPNEWHFERATLTGPDGKVLVDSNDHNLHVMSYSSPVDAELSLEELQAHLHSLPEQPDLIPYRTNYYTENWAFCLTQRQRDALQPGQYRAKIDSRLEPGALTYGECFVPGTTDDELLISTHICHPSLANDNLSGISVATALAKQAAAAPPGRYGLRFVFVPSTIGAITWLAVNQAKRANIVAGLVISGVGDAGPLTYKKSRRGDGLIDRACMPLIEQAGGSVRPFLPYGYDERQYCSPGIDIPMGCLMRTPYGEYPEYHTSADNLSLIQPAQLEATYDFCHQMLTRIQTAKRYLSLNPECEPQLGRRGLYQAMGGNNETKNFQLALLWVLGYSDGSYSLDDLHDLSGIEPAVLQEAAGRLEDAKLLQAID